jgi:arylformamidase
VVQAASPFRHLFGGQFAIHTRRSILSAAATVVGAGPALAQTPCLIGPPPHVKGPRVWLDMDQIELDASYNQAFYAPLEDEIIRRYASNSELVRARLGEPRREAQYYHNFSARRV